MSGSIVSPVKSELNTFLLFWTVSGLDLSSDLVFFAVFDFFFLLLAFLITGITVSSESITSSRGGRSESKMTNGSEPFSGKSSPKYSIDSITDDAMEASSPSEPTSDIELSDSSEKLACS